jgi:signal transduction histidine kinase
MAHPDHAPWPKIAERAAEQTQRMEDLVLRLLVLAKADDRRLSTRRAPVDLARLLGEIRTAIAAATTRGIRIGLQTAPDLVVMGDATDLERMIRNIVDNAVRYARTAVTVTAAAAADGARIEVDDDGPGIPPEDRMRVFGRFVRLDDSRDRSTGSSGLGLAIAREIALAHNGRIAISGSPAHGTRVAIDLPGGPWDT